MLFRSGYAKVSKEEKAVWGDIIEGYLKNSKTLKHVFIIADIRICDSPKDIQIITYCYHYNIPFTIIAYEEISVNEKITLMNELLEKKDECMFTDLIVRHGNVLDVICAFMALLEAVKFKMATIMQNRMFGDIKICRYAA